MKKWLLALMICLSFSTLTAGLFLLPQTINAVYQREQEENDQESQGSAATRHYEWSSTTAVRTISLQMNGKTATNSRTTTVYANSLYDVWLIDDSGLIYQSFSDEQNGDEDAPTHANGPVLPDTSLGNMVHIAKTSLTNTTSRTITNWNNDKKITVPTVTGYNFLGYYSSSSGGTQYINASGQVQSAGENSISYGATGTGYWYAHWEAAATPISLGLYAYFNDADGNNQSGWVAGLSVQHSTNNSSWSNCSQTGSGYSYDYVGYNYDVYQGYYLRFKINCESGYATWKITNSSGTRVWPSGDGYYYAGIYSSSTSYNVYPVAGYQVSFYAQSNGTVQHQTSSPKMSSISAGAKSGQAISVSGANYWTTSVYNTYFDIYARANSGYTFSYWSPSTTGTLTAARTVYAYFDRPKYQITLNVNGATSGSNQTVYGRYMYSSLYANSTVSNTTTATISSPYKSNCYFAGWTKTQDGTDYVINSSGQLVANTAYTNSSRQWTYQGSVTLYAKFYFSVTVHFTMQGPGEIVEDEACRYGYDTSSDELEIYFDEWDDMQVYWYGSDQITIEIHGGAGGLFTLTTDYYFTGELDYDFDDSSGSYEMPDDGSDYFYIAADDTIYNDIWIYFYTYKYATIGRNNTSYGTISQSRVEIPGTSTYSITSSGSTVTINGVSVTATPASSTTGFTYAFGSWTIPSDYASSSFPTITANFTRSINTRSVTLATRIISKAGNVGSSNAIPSGASLGVSYTNGSANATSSTQSGASTAYTIQAGTNMTITVTTPAGYKYIGYNISTSKPTVNSFPTSSTLTAPSAGTYYFFFEEIAAPLYYTTERGGYWYYEDGKYPQTYVGTSLSGASASNQTFYLNWKTGENTSYNSYGNYKVYTVGNSKYIYVESPMSGTIKFNGQTVTLASGTKYWFRIDPIRWRVSKYGASASEYALGSTTSNLVGVSDILGYGRVNTNASITDTQNMTNAYQDCSAVGYTNASTNIWRDMYTYQEGNSTKVNIHIAEVTQASKMLVASPDSLNATGDIRSYASDLSAMLECRDYNNSTGWTSGMYNISSGIVVGPGASYTGKYWANTDNVFGFVYAHQASYATCLGGSNGLAAGYTIVEYIQSNGGQFINTGVKNLSGNFSIEVKYNKTNTDTSDQCLFGQRQFGKFEYLWWLL